MDDVEIDLRELEEFEKELEDLQKLFPRQARQLMGKIGSKARTIVKKKAKLLVRKETGNYLKSIKRGKPWEDKTTGEYKVRVYTRAPHGHLIEKGHRIVGKDGSEHGFKEGSFVFEKAGKEIDKQWEDIARKEFDKITAKL
jgi:hypothetical protein